MNISESSHLSSVGATLSPTLSISLNRVSGKKPTKDSPQPGEMPKTAFHLLTHGHTLNKMLWHLPPIYPQSHLVRMAGWSDLLPSLQSWGNWPRKKNSEPKINTKFQLSDTKFKLEDVLIKPSSSLVHLKSKFNLRCFSIIPIRKCSILCRSFLNTEIHFLTWKHFI